MTVTHVTLAHAPIQPALGLWIEGRARMMAPRSWALLPVGLMPLGSVALWTAVGSILAAAAAFAAWFFLFPHSSDLPAREVPDA
jgi:hypothetical protein